MLTTELVNSSKYTVNMMMYCKIYQHNESPIAFIHGCKLVQHNYLPSTAESFILTAILRQIIVHFKI